MGECGVERGEVTTGRALLCARPSRSQAYFGGKRRIASAVWSRLGDTANYVEPFAGSLAVMLARPDAHRWWERTETINDADGLVSNFWRAVRADPDAVARWADWPVSENDLHARHGWLVARKDALQTALEGDPDYHDAKIAGWWLWGICLWIGSGWCSGDGPWRQVDGKLVHLGNAGQGINRKRVHLSNAGQGINRQLVHLGNAGQGDAGQGHAGQGHADAWSAHIQATMQTLADRLRKARICCGDWSRVATPAVTEQHGLTSIFLDPPYGHDERHDTIYRVEMDTATAVRDWAVANGGNPLLRIALCGYDGEHDLPDTWERLAWKTAGGYGSQAEDGAGRVNSARETVWFSPHCLRPTRARQAALWSDESEVIE